MNPHPTDSIPAFVLGALDPEEALQVSMHVAACPECRAEADSFRDAVEALPHVAPQPAPPPHIKQQLFARVTASQATPRAPARPRARWPMAVSAGSLALALGFGYMMADARSRLDLVAGQLTQTQQMVDKLQQQIVADEQLDLFITAPQTVSRTLAGTARAASAVMYMQPKSSHAVLVMHNMPPVESGKVYQFWLAKPGVQVPASTFEVDQAGTAKIAIDAPAPINEYDQVMVTIERSGGSTQPSDQVVLSGEVAGQPAGIALAPRRVAWR
jgi:anti-sigma-K factor RskA